MQIVFVRLTWLRLDGFEGRGIAAETQNLSRFLLMTPSLSIWVPPDTPMVCFGQLFDYCLLHFENLLTRIIDTLDANGRQHGMCGKISDKMHVLDFCLRLFLTSYIRIKTSIHLHVN